MSYVFTDQREEREAFRQMYPEQWLSLLEEVLTLIGRVENRDIPGPEAEWTIKRRFRELMFPACHKRVKALESRLEQEEQRRNMNAARVEDLRQQRLRDEIAETERVAAMKYEAQVEKGRAEERQLEEARLKLAQS